MEIRNILLERIERLLAMALARSSSDPLHSRVCTWCKGWRNDQWTVFQNPEFGSCGHPNRTERLGSV